MTCLRISDTSQKDIYLRYISQKYLLQVFVTFQKYLTKTVSCDVPKVIEIADEIDMRPLKMLKKRKVFWKQCIVNNQVYH